MGKVNRVVIQKRIKAPLADVFEWFYKSENFTKSPIVFQSKWKDKKYQKGAKRDIIMVAGWYSEEITAIERDVFIEYKVNRSFPKVQQDYTQIAFEEVQGETLVTWTIEIAVLAPIFSSPLSFLAGKMAKTLYATIMTAGKKVLEDENQ